MAPLPKRKYPKARRGKRQSHLAMTAPHIMECPQCHAPKLPHHVCQACGTYNGRTVIEVETAKKKKKAS